MFCAHVLRTLWIFNPNPNPNPNPLTTKTVETVLYSDSDLAKLVLLFFNIKIIWDRTSEDSR